MYTITDHHLSVDESISRADSAMYQAKKAGEIVWWFTLILLLSLSTQLLNLPVKHQVFHVFSSAGGFIPSLVRYKTDLYCMDW
ncbi:hypothetical protein ACBQ19_04875 [Hafnia alvei]